MAIGKTDLYYIWLGVACDFEPKLMDLCFNSMTKSEDFDPFSSLYSSAEYMYSIYENRKEIQKRIDKSNYKNRINLNVPLAEAEEIAKECERLKIQVVTLCSKLYPNRLRNIYCPPKLLFVKGDISGVDDVLGISIVGTRSATKAGIANTEKIAYDLASRGVIVVSGMATGIDSAAHAGALAANGRTFAVLAGGVDVVYPAVNRDIYEMLCESGAVISERPPHCIGRPEFYQQRNRIITGLSLGVLIAEGKEKSGTSITARLASENNRDIFAIPNDIKLAQAQLPNSLIKEGAILIRGAADILSQYKYIYPELEIDGNSETNKKNKLAEIFNRLRKNSTENKSGIKKSEKSAVKHKNSENAVNTNSETAKTTDIEDNIENLQKDINIISDAEKFFGSKEFEQLSDEDKRIFEFIGTCESGATIDGICEELGIEVNSLTSKVLMWQIKGLIVQKGGSKLYIKI